MCLTKGEYPHILKMWNIVPVYKRKGNKSCIESHRSISIQPIIGQLFESLIQKQLLPHLRRLIVDEQHGFQSQKSTFTNLACYADFISTYLDNKQADFKHAFGVIPHTYFYINGNVCLVWFHDTVLQFFESYLSNRLQRVVFNGVASELT